MSRVRFSFPTTKEGEDFMKEFAKSFDLELESVDSNLRITTDDFIVKCQLDFDGTASIMIKILNEDRKEELEQFYSKYK